MSALLSSIRAAAIDGRAHGVYYRQQQLENLHNALVKDVDEIVEAIISDRGHSSTEATIEISLTLAAIERDYVSLQPSQSLAEEYLLANGDDAPLNRRPAGIVYIKPCSHTSLFSAIAPLSAAVAAGNCVIILLENNLYHLNRLLRKVLSSTLSLDTFAIVSSPIQDPEILNAAVIVDQDSDAFQPRANEIVSLSHSLTVAVVDRTADLIVAAHELTAARLSFGGGSPYAPDIVLVNEFVKQPLMQALQEENRMIVQQRCMGDDAGGTLRKEKSITTQLEILKAANPSVEVCMYESHAAITELSSRQRKGTIPKVKAPILVIHAVKSLDDAIDFANSLTQQPMLAAYHFGTTAVGKYLAQFLEANVSFLNYVPRELLVGPAFPSTYTVNPEIRYTTKMFSLPSPGFVRPSASTRRLAHLLKTTPQSEDIHAFKIQFATPLKAMKRNLGGGIGYFEQAFLINVGLILVATVGTAVTGYLWLRRCRGKS